MKWLIGVCFAATVAHAQGLNDVKELTLQNGMKWLVVERHDAPVFTGFVRVRVGGADEETGYTGLAHLFEHMAFKGTPSLGTSDWNKEQPLLLEIASAGDELAALEQSGQGKTDRANELRLKLAELSKRHKALTDENALARLYQVNGGVGLNATTDKDLTSYFVSLPKNRLELWLTVEAQRLAAPVLRDFYTERSVVQEERRMSIDSNPGGVMFEELNQVAFSASPYRWSTVGYAGDLSVMPISKAHDFFEKFYAPSNAVGAIVGDVKLEEVKALLEKTFATIPARPRPPQPRFTEPESRAQRRSIVQFDAAPRLIIAFRKPPPPDRDDNVFDVLETLLSEGRTGRLQKRLVFQDHLAQGVGVFGGPGARLENLFIISVTPLAGVTTERIEKAIWEELNALKTTPVAARELEKVRNRMDADRARWIESNGGLADGLARFQALLDDWRYLERLPSIVASITTDDVQRVSQKYFTIENSVVITMARPEVTK